MKEYGIIVDFDGYCGIAISKSSKEYLLLKKEFLYEDIKRGNLISFIPEIVKTPTESKLVARFINKVQ